MNDTEVIGIGVGSLPDEAYMDAIMKASSLEEVCRLDFGGGDDLSSYLGSLLTEQGLSKGEVIKRSGLNPTFGYQIFSGTRNPGRDKILQLAIALEASLPETNELLRLAGWNALYARNRRDAIIVYCRKEGLDLQKTDESLYLHDEDTLTEQRDSNGKRTTRAGKRALPS